MWASLPPSSSLYLRRTTGNVHYLQWKSLSTSIAPRLGRQAKVTYHLIDFEDHSTTAVYKCFLTQRCVYLCLWNVAEGKKGLEGLLPWLHCIHSSVSNAAVILVGTHADQDPELDVSAQGHPSFAARSPKSPLVSFSSSHGLQTRVSK